MRFRVRCIFSVERLRQQRVCAGSAAALEQVVVERQVVEEARAFAKRERLDLRSVGTSARRRSRRRRSSAATDLVAQEAIGIVERRDEHVDRLLRRDARQRGRNVAAHPDVFVGSARKYASASTTGSP